MARKDIPGTDRPGPHADPRSERLRRYWTTGPGGAKIAWGVPGDWRRCVAQLTEHLGAGAKGYCNLRHKEMTGRYPGEKVGKIAKSVWDDCGCEPVVKVNSSGILPTNTEDNMSDGVSIPMNIEKRDDDRRLVFGFAKFAEDPENRGYYYVDKQQDIIHPDDLEESAYDYVLTSRDAGEMHVTKGAGSLVESFVVTPEKLEKMGLPGDSLPAGWWVGYKVDNDDAWSKIKSGEYAGFSVEGVARRVPVEQTTRKRLAKRWRDAVAKVRRPDWNPADHPRGPDGRFIPKGLGWLNDLFDGFGADVHRDALYAVDRDLDFDVEGMSDRDLGFDQFEMTVDRLRESGKGNIADELTTIRQKAGPSDFDEALGRELRAEMGLIRTERGEDPAPSALPGDAPGIEVSGAPDVADDSADIAEALGRDGGDSDPADVVEGTTWDDWNNDPDMLADAVTDRVVEANPDATDAEIDEAVERATERLGTREPDAPDPAEALANWDRIAGEAGLPSTDDFLNNRFATDEVRRAVERAGDDANMVEVNLGASPDDGQVIMDMPTARAILAEADRAPDVASPDLGGDDDGGSDTDPFIAGVVEEVVGNATWDSFDGDEEILQDDIRDTLASRGQSSGQNMRAAMDAAIERLNANESGGGDRSPDPELEGMSTELLQRRRNNLVDRSRRGDLEPGERDELSDIEAELDRRSPDAGGALDPDDPQVRDLIVTRAAEILSDNPQMDAASALGDAADDLGVDLDRFDTMGQSDFRRMEREANAGFVNIRTGRTREAEGRRAELFEDWNRMAREEGLPEVSAILRDQGGMLTRLRRAVREEPDAQVLTVKPAGGVETTIDMETARAILLEAGIRL